MLTADGLSQCTRDGAPCTYRFWDMYATCD